MQRWVRKRWDWYGWRLGEVLRARSDSGQIRVHSEMLEIPGSCYEHERGARPGGTSSDFLLTEEMWPLFQWNAPFVIFSDGTKQYYPVEENLTPKPPWTTIKRWLEEHEMTSRVANFQSWQGLEGSEEYARQSKEAIVSAPVPHSLALAGIHIGAGLDHAPAMIYNAAHAGNAGVTGVPAVMKDGAGEPVELWTQGEKHELLESQAAAVNLAESARNIIEQRIREMAAPWFDERGGLDDTASDDEVFAARWDSYLAVHNFLQHDVIDAAMKAEVARLNDETRLPNELSRLKNRLVELLEACATGHQKNLKGAFTQQAIDNWAACEEIDEALSEIAKQCIIGALAITKTDDTAKAKAAFDKAKAAIEAIYPANAPDWYFEDQLVTSLPATVTLAPGVTSATFIARHPTDKTIEGDVSFHPISDTTEPLNEDGTRAEGFTLDRRAAPTEPEALQVIATLQTAPTQKVTVLLQARNVCGPSPLIVIFQP